MSQYSDFFGVASGGGAGSVPINGYLSFLTYDDDNPTGFVSSSGIYTDSDSQVFMKTGEVIEENSPSAGGPMASYPYASYRSTVTAQLMQQQPYNQYDCPPGGPQQRGASNVPGENQARVYIFTNPSFQSIGTETGFSFGSNQGGARGYFFGAKDINEGYLRNGTTGVQTSAVSNPWTINVNRSWGDGNAYNGRHIYNVGEDTFFTYDTVGDTAPVYNFVEFNNDATLSATGNTFTATVPTSNTNGNFLLTDNGQYLLYSGTNGTMEFFTFATESLDATWAANATINPGPSQFVNGIGFTTTIQTYSRYSYQIKQFAQAPPGRYTQVRKATGNQNTLLSIGDPTGKTDSDTSQQLFIRIG